MKTDPGALLKAILLRFIAAIGIAVFWGPGLFERQGAAAYP